MQRWRDCYHPINGHLPLKETRAEPNFCSKMFLSPTPGLDDDMSAAGRETIMVLISEDSSEFEGQELVRN